MEIREGVKIGVDLWEASSKRELKDSVTLTVFIYLFILVFDIFPRRGLICESMIVYLDKASIFFFQYLLSIY